MYQGAQSSKNQIKGYAEWVVAPKMQEMPITDPDRGCQANVLTFAMYSNPGEQESSHITPNVKEVQFGASPSSCTAG